MRNFLLGVKRVWFELFWAEAQARRQRQAQVKAALLEVFKSHRNDTLYMQDIRDLLRSRKELPTSINDVKIAVKALKREGYKILSYESPESPSDGVYRYVG